MSKVRISQTEQLVGKSRATIYRDIEKGLVSHVKLMNAGSR